MKIDLNILNDRNKSVFNQIIENYLKKGSPIASKALSEESKNSISSSSLRHIMSELEEMGLLYSPHVSSGRVPTELGLRLYVNSLMGISWNINDEEKDVLNSLQLAGQRGTKELVSQVSASLSGITSHAGIVVTPKSEIEIKHIEFVRISKLKALVVLVDKEGNVENRIIDISDGTPDIIFEHASNYINSKIKGQSIEDLKKSINKEIELHRLEIDSLAAKLINEGLAVWSNDGPDPSLVVCGHDNLLENINAIEDLDKIKVLFSALGKQESSIKLLEELDLASGVQIFIGAENRLFTGTDCSLVIAPYQNMNKQIIGALGVIGPTRMNYSKIIPIVDYTSQVVSGLFGGNSKSEEKNHKK